MHNRPNQRATCCLGSAFLHLPSNTLIYILLVERGWQVWKKNNPGHLEKGRIIEPFISHNSERPYISNKRNKPKRHTMTQMYFCWNPVQFHFPLFVFLLIHCLKMSHFFETVYTDIKTRWNIPLQKYWFEGLCPLGIAPKRHKAYSISKDFMAPFGTSQNGFHRQAPIGPWKQLCTPKPAGSDWGIARTKFTAVCQLCLITYHV